MKNIIPKFLQEQFLNNNARPKFFSDEMKQFILDYGKFYEFPNDKRLEGNHLLALWFRYMKSGIDEIGQCEYKECMEKQKIVHISKSNKFKVSRGCCSSHSGKIVTLEKYGVENVMQNKSVKEKLKNTMLEKYGVENPMQNENIKKKLINNNLQKYGVENVMHIPSIYKKAQENSFLEKDFLWKTGEISKVQGYEDKVLRELEEKGYTFQDVITDVNKIPSIKYFFDGKERTYYPDIFIPRENLIIEVKSEYTLNVELTQNKAKFEATKNAGFNFRLEIR